MFNRLSTERFLKTKPDEFFLFIDFFILLPIFMCAAMDWVI